MTDKEEKVYNILLMPIRCGKRVSQIAFQDGAIISPQLYYSLAD